MDETEKNKRRLLKKLSKPRTANEAIEILYQYDCKWQDFKGWRYYVHLNKLLSPLERAGKIKQVGLKVGPTKRLEKLWLRV